MDTRQRTDVTSHPDDALRGDRDAAAQGAGAGADAQDAPGDPRGAAASLAVGLSGSPDPKEGCDLSIICPVCMIAMHPEHAHYRCSSCGYRDSCCF